MLNTDYIAYAMIAVGIFTFYMAVMNILRSNRGNERINNAVIPLSAYQQELSDNEEVETEPLLVRLGAKIMPKNKNNSALRHAVLQKLIMSGITGPYAVEYFLLFKIFVKPVILIFGLYICYSAIQEADLTDLLLELFLGGVVVLIGANGANLYVTNHRDKRVALLMKSFPEMMDLLLVCIEAGLGLDAALGRVCKELREMHPVIVEELDRTRMELTVLGDRVTALQNMMERTNIVAFNTLVSALIQTEKFGTSLVETLRVLAEEQRLTRLYATEQKAARIMPAFIVIILAPPFIRLAEEGGIGGALSR